jgi:hypothetical protein
MADRGFSDRTGPRMAAAFAGVLVVIVAAIVVWALLLAPPAGEPAASPTAAGMDSPSPAKSPGPDQTASPEPTVTVEPTASPQPTTTAASTSSPEPTVSPGATASPGATSSPAGTASPGPTAPPTAGPSPSAVPTVAPQTGWIEVTDFPTYRGSTEVQSITAGGPGFVAVGTGGRVMHGRVWTSRDGLRWTAQADDQFAGVFLRQVVRMGGDLYAFGRDSDGTRVWRSGNGRSWSLLEQSPEFAGAGVNDVAVSGGTMVAVGFTREPDLAGAVWRSTDGVDWQRVASPEGIEDGVLWAVAAQGSTIVGFPRWHIWRGPLIVYSNNLGDSWQAAEVDLELGEDFGAGLVGLAVSGGRFVAVGYHERDRFVPIALTSRDGSSWTSVTPPVSDTLGQLVVLRDGTLVAFEAWYGARSAGALVSADGQTWRPIAPLYTDQRPPVPPEGGDEFVTQQAAAASGAGVVVAVEWGNSVRVWFGPLSLFE